MIEEFLPIIYVGIAGTVAAIIGKAWFRMRETAIRAANQQKIDSSKPEAAVDQFLALVSQAPQMLEVARGELQKIKDSNKGKNIDLSAQEQEIKWLELLAKYNRPLMIAAPILAPIAKRYVKGLSKAL